LGEGESWRTLLRATAQGEAGLSFGDASLPEAASAGGSNLAKTTIRAAGG
jgi:hypothetical protein